jgi:hypothetical protein
MTQTPRRRSLRGVPCVFDDKQLHPTFRFWISLGSHPATELLADQPEATMAAVRECPSWHIPDHVWAGSCMGRTAMFVKPTGSREKSIERFNAWRSVRELSNAWQAVLGQRGAGYGSAWIEIVRGSRTRIETLTGVQDEIGQRKPRAVYGDELSDRCLAGKFQSPHQRPDFLAVPLDDADRALKRHAHASTGRRHLRVPFPRCRRDQRFQRTSFGGLSAKAVATSRCQARRKAARRAPRHLWPAASGGRFTS